MNLGSKNPTSGTNSFIWKNNMLMVLVNLIYVGTEP